MSDGCQVIFTFGPNMGKKCCDVTKKCKHKTKKVCVCGYETFYTYNLKRHLKKCKEVSKTQKNQVSQSVEVSPKNPKLDLKSKPILKPKITPILKPRTPPQVRTQVQSQAQAHVNHSQPEQVSMSTIKALEERLNQISSENEQMKIHISELENRNPTTIINFNNNNYNIAVMNPNFFTELEHQTDHDMAIKMLVTSAANNQPLDVLKSLYFKGNDPNEYPIASKNGRYRYLNDSGDLVEDDGKFLSTIVANRIQKAMSYATGTLIRNMTAEFEVDRMYDTYDLGKIQSNICNFPINHMVAELNLITENPSHPFFMDGVKVICLEG